MPEGSDNEHQLANVVGQILRRDNRSSLAGILAASGCARDSSRRDAGPEVSAGLATATWLIRPSSHCPERSGFPAPAPLARLSRATYQRGCLRS